MTTWRRTGCSFVYDVGDSVVFQSSTTYFAYRIWRFRTALVKQIKMTDNKSLGIILAITAGIMAALASVSAKLAMSAEQSTIFCAKILQSVFTETSQTASICESVTNILRLGCFGCIFLFNALMWTFYTKSLQHCPSTVEATVTNTGSNFLFTAVIGLTLFGEHLSMCWWLGSFLIFGGLILIHKGTFQQTVYKNYSLVLIHKGNQDTEAKPKLQ